MRFASLVAVLALVPTVVSPAEAVEFFVVVNEANPVKSLTRTRVSDIYLGRVTVWEHKVNITPVNQSALTPVRQSFTKKVHAQSLGQVEAHWREQVFSGRGSPPSARPGDTDVLRFVQDTPGAIGYVASLPPAHPGIKIVTIVD